MTYPELRISGAPGDPHPLRGDAAPGPDLPLTELLPAITQAAADGAKLVLLWGHQPARHPELPAILAACRARGLATSLRGPASTLPASRLASLDVELVWLPCHGLPASHDRLLDLPGDSDALTAWLAQRHRARVRVWTELRAETLPELPELTRRLLPHAEALTLRHHGGTLPHDALRDALDAVWTARRGHPIELHLDGLSTPPDDALGPPRPYDPALLSLRVQGGWLPGLRGGVHGAPDELQPALFALGLSSTPAEAPHRPLRGPVAVIAPAMGDTLLATSTLPGLAHALSQRGLRCTLHTVWDAPWNLYGPAAFDPAGPGLPARPDVDVNRTLQRVRTAHELGPAFLQHLDLRDAATILVPGWQAALAVLRHPTRRPDSRLIVLDLHLLDGVSAWTDAFAAPGAPPATGGWFPDDDVEICSCFPGYAANYLQRGVPLDRVRWRPYPVFEGHLPPGDDVRRSTHLATAGNHRRDHRLLSATCALLPDDTPPILLHSGSPPTAVGPLRPAGHVSLSELYRTVATSRCLVLPLQWSAHDAAGITLAALALAAGRPVLASRTWAMLDHVQHGVSGLLVEPDDPHALAASITAVCRDPELLHTLAAGAAAAGRALSVAAWADDLLTGQPAWPRRG